MKRVYRQFPIDPKDYKYLSFQWDGFPYFDTRYSFVLRSFALICKRTTRADIHVFTAEGYTTNIYLDDFHGAEHLSNASSAFARLQKLSSSSIISQKRFSSFYTDDLPRASRR